MSAPEDQALLRVAGLHAYYGKSHVLQGVDLHIGRGEIVSLLGRNGVGRSTTAKAIMSLVQCKGSVRFRGREMIGLRTFEIANEGVGYVPESRDIFPTLTVEQNLILGRKSGGGQREGNGAADGGAGSNAAAWQIDDMYRMFPRLKERQHVQAGVLSGGEQQMLTLCRTLLGNPELIMIDEPTEGLAPKIVIALEISQRVYVMGHGSIVFEGTPAQLREAADIRRDWLEV
jgi:branched-chain amino acid transport system ATP-binding protein